MTSCSRPWPRWKYRISASFSLFVSRHLLAAMASSPRLLLTQAVRHQNLLHWHWEDWGHIGRETEADKSEGPGTQSFTTFDLKGNIGMVLHHTSHGIWSAEPSLCSLSGRALHGVEDILDDTMWIDVGEDVLCCS